jgi:leucyl/phenylalanyl-tRNA--protein transferase
MSLHLPRLARDPLAPFPPAHTALRHPNGLLAFGGDLSVPRLLNAYRQGIFPWYSEGQPILWWSPDPRMVLHTATMQLPRRLRRSLRRSRWRISADRDFGAVVRACASSPRAGQDGTWITPAMEAAYIALHQAGHAHSVEVWDSDGALAGGIYGVCLGRMVFGESMFSAQSGGSRVALAALCRVMAAQGMPLLDGQVESPHLLALGGQPMPRRRFLAELPALVADAVETPGWPASWPLADAAELA